MDQSRYAELLMQHRHPDGTLGEVRERRGHHDAADHDVERSWPGAKIYECTRCTEEFTVIPGTEGGPPARR